MLKEIAFRIARRRVCVGSFSATAESGLQSREDTGQYHHWRQQTLEQEFDTFFGKDYVAGKDVLDFGCGTGPLSFLVARLGAKSVIGMDLSERDIESARGRLNGEPIQFVRATSATKIDLADNSIDVITCFDVMEHVMEYRDIMAEWFRILRPGGRVLIHWQPWFHPYGHHAHDYLPIPWVHAFLDDKARTEVCARIVDLPEFKAPWWDLDAEGNRINRFRQALKEDAFDKKTFLNELTMSRFERICRKIGLRIESRRLTHFEGPAIVRGISRVGTLIPGVREFLTANSIYVLRK